MNGNYNLIAKQGATDKDKGGNVFITVDGDCDITSKTGAIKLKGKVSINGTKYD